MNFGIIMAGRIIELLWWYKVGIENATSIVSYSTYGCMFQYFECGPVTIKGDKEDPKVPGGPALSQPCDSSSNY